MRITALLLAAGVAIFATLFFGRLDTYTAVVDEAQFLDSDQGKTSKFITVQPQQGWQAGIEDGTLKLRIVDSHVPYFAWATNGDRARKVKAGEVVCIKDRGYRNNWFSVYPTLVSITPGACQ